MNILLYIIHLMSANKEELKEAIREWILLDNEIKTLQTEMKSRKEKKKYLSDKLVNIMRDNEIDCFNVNDGKLIYSQTKVKSSINKNYLLATINKLIEDEEKAEEMTKYILENRDIKIKESIKRKKNN